MEQVDEQRNSRMESKKNRSLWADHVRDRSLTLEHGFPDIVGSHRLLNNAMRRLFAVYEAPSQHHRVTVHLADTEVLRWRWFG